MGRARLVATTPPRSERGEYCRTDGSENITGTWRRSAVSAVTPWAQQRIALLADALLRNVTFEQQFAVGRLELPFPLCDEIASRLTIFTPTQRCHL